MPAAHLDDPLRGLTVLERGWLSSNNLLIHAARGEAGAVLVDTGHCNHAAQTEALVAHALAQSPSPGGDALALIVNTHLHSDHCGGNARLQQRFNAPVAIPPGQAQAVQRWDEDALSYRATGQCMVPFSMNRALCPGEPLLAGGREWQVLAAPGHDPHSVLFFDAAGGVLCSADALWEQGFGIVFPELEGEPGFDDVGQTLDLIAGLPVRLVVPGHGRPFDDVAGALARARSRLAALQADPAKHARHAVKVLIKYHLMEVQREPLSRLLDWAAQAPLLGLVWTHHRPAGQSDVRAWLTGVVQDLVAGGALAADGEWVVDRA